MAAAQILITTTLSLTLTTDANSGHDPTPNLTVTLGQVWQLLAVANFTQARWPCSKYIHS